MFTADTDGENGGETYFFISLKNYLQNVYTTENTNSIEMNITPDNKIKANLKIKSGENSVKVDEPGTDCGTKLYSEVELTKDVISAFCITNKPICSWRSSIL